MNEVLSGGAARYRAFISYSHRDAAFGRRLHRRLEGYRLPRRLVGKPGPFGPAPARLSPIFRDRDELPAANDLTAEVRAALAGSAALIVVCSPSSAASVWVGREIETFRALHPDRPVLAAVIGGEPGDCFPPSLLLAGVEPLAADFRRDGDGDRLAFLKLVAGVGGVGLDELIQRDAQRRLARVTAVTAGAVLSALTMAGMTAFALQARAEAERERRAAEGLVEFMLTDLRDNLKGVGRLDVQTTVNQEALTYYLRRDEALLRPEALYQKARVLHLLGEDDLDRGESEKAEGRFREARRITAVLFIDAPTDPERVFAHAQSEFWIGRLAFERKQYKAARTAFESYRELTGQLLALRRGDARSFREVGYAEGNLCTVAGLGFRDMTAALGHCRKALDAMQAAAKAAPDDIEIAKALINRLGWLADAHRANGEWDMARERRLEQERRIDGLIERDPLDADLWETWIATQRAIARIDRQNGRSSAAGMRLSGALDRAEMLVRLDSKNMRWKKMAAQISSEFSEIKH